jgi:hypothetical protein
MTACFLALYETPSDPEAFDRHYTMAADAARLQELAPVRIMIFTAEENLV